MCEEKKNEYVSDCRTKQPSKIIFIGISTAFTTVVGAYQYVRTGNTRNTRLWAYNKAVIHSSGSRRLIFFLMSAWKAL